MENNSAEAVAYISSNLDKIVKMHSKRAPTEAVEDMCQRLILSLLDRPRYIPNIPAYINVALKRQAIHHHRYLKRFLYISSFSHSDSNEELDLELEDKECLYQEIEDRDLMVFNIKSLDSLMKSSLTEVQMQSVKDFIANDGRHKTELSKVHFHQSVSKLRGKKISSKKELKKRGRKKGYVPKLGVKLGRKSSITPDLTKRIVNASIIVDGYVSNMAHLVRTFNISDTTITKVLKAHVPELNKSRKKSFSLDFLKEEAKKFKNRTSWQESSPGQYQRARKMGWLDECTSHMRKSR